MLLLAALLLQTAACGSGGSGEKTPSDASDSSSAPEDTASYLDNFKDLTDTVRPFLVQNLSHANADGAVDRSEIGTELFLM